MLFREKYFLSLRLRILLALTAAAGAGIFLTYSAAIQIVGPLVAEDSGARVFSGLKTYADAIDSEIASGLERARLIAARPGLREILYRRNRGGDPEADAEALQLALKAAARATAGAAALTLTDAKGALAGAFEEPGGAKVSRETGAVTVGPEEGYVGPPLIDKGALFYEVAVAVPYAGKEAQGQAGTLRCRFKAAGVLRRDLPASGGAPDFSLAGLRGRNLVITSMGKPREEVALDSEKAAPFRPILQGKEGYSVPPGRGGGMIYAYSRLPSADWLIAAQARTPDTALLHTEAILKKIRLQAWLFLALLTIGAFIIANKLLLPIAGNARLAAALLQEFGAPGAENRGTREETELIGSALTEAGALLRQRAEHGLRLQSETEKLREEETELKYQNLELEKLNKYLLERETKISELKGEICELRGRITSGAAD